MAEVVFLERYRAARVSAAVKAGPPKPMHLTAAPDRVVLVFTNGDELDLSPESARVWAERLAAMADVAAALGRDERALLGLPEGGGDDV